MKPACLILLVFGCLISTLVADELKIPEGVRYKKASDEVNQQAREKIQKLFTAKATDEEVLSLFFKKTLICGPGLWLQLKNDPTLAKIETGKVNISMPIVDASGATIRTDKAEGKLFQSEKEVLAFWRAFAKQAEFTELKIRKLNPEELSIFWAMISFDITEPIFILEGKQQKVLLVFKSPEDLSVVWIDDYQQVSLKEKANTK